jgi:hypothetical protein
MVRRVQPPAAVVARQRKQRSNRSADFGYTLNFKKRPFPIGSGRFYYSAVVVLTLFPSDLEHRRIFYEVTVLIATQMGDVATAKRVHAAACLDAGPAVMTEREVRVSVQPCQPKLFKYCRRFPFTSGTPAN